MGGQPDRQALAGQTIRNDLKIGRRSRPIFLYRYNCGMRKVAVIAGPESWRIGHGPAHPLKPERLERTFLLWTALGALEAEHVSTMLPRPVKDSELTVFHKPNYVETVQRLSRGEAPLDSGRFGFGTGDNPVFLGMFESEGLKVGAALQAADLILAGDCDVAFSFTGGLHHGGPDFACGFCVFNDIVVAIYRLIEHDLRVAYIDIDVHHGDGVQDAFYDSDRVLTISLHQDGRTLFPGTGSVEETGAGLGLGYTANIPLPPYTTDEDYLFAFDQTVPLLIERFEPDVVVTQLGVDTHYQDPLAQLALTIQGQEAIFERLEHLCPRWLALGGGGYNLDVVPRSWSLALGVMAGLDLPEMIPHPLRSQYARPYLRDKSGPQIAAGARSNIRSMIEATVARLKTLHAIG